MSEERVALKPLPERPAAEILRTIVDVLVLVRLMHHQARGETFFICDRGASAGGETVPIYVQRELPLREASDLLAELLRGRPSGDRWRWRLCLCPAEKRTRENVHTLLMAPPAKDRPWSEPMWMCSTAAARRGQRMPRRVNSRDSRRPMETH